MAMIQRRDGRVFQNPGPNSIVPSLDTIKARGFKAKRYKSQSAYDVPCLNGCMHFSYQTMIAFTLYGKTFIRRNEWGNTTARHIRRIARMQYGRDCVSVDSKGFENAWLDACDKILPV